MQSYNQFGPNGKMGQNMYGQSYAQKYEDNKYYFVNGIEGAKAFQMLPNTSVMLLDSDSDLIFKKSSDIQGRSTLRYFKMIEVTEDDLKEKPIQPPLNFVSREEFDELSKKLDMVISRLEKPAKKDKQEV